MGIGLDFNVVNTARDFNSEFHWKVTAEPWAVAVPSAWALV